jgi:cytochrome c553
VPDAPPIDTPIDAAPTELPMLLSQTGLYTDIAAKTLDPSSRLFAPRHELWSDAAQKTRWIQLPDGGVIDSSDMDHWAFPVGTKLFKEFAKDGKRLETRLVWRVADTGDRERDTLFGAYLWNDSETEATFARDGGENLRGTQHDAPSADTCWKCHIGEPGRALGISAIQLGDTLPLSVPPSGTPAAPNDAMGYLHANCGHCHNPNGSAWSTSSMVLRLAVTDTDAASTQLYQTTVGVPLQQWLNHGYADRIVAGDADTSAIHYRMTQRTANMQMPPIATEVPDTEGTELVRLWIDSL